METKFKIYYAHFKKIYGTSSETEELKFIKEKYPNSYVFCPNTTIGELNDFQDYLHVVDCCSKIIVSEVEAHIGKGVFCEIARGFGNGSQIYVLRNLGNKYSLAQVTGIEMVNQSDWKNKFGKLIVKN
jgi:hypothetical protein